MNSCPRSSIGVVIYDAGLDMTSDWVAAGLLVAVRDTETHVIVQPPRHLVPKQTSLAILGCSLGRAGISVRPEILGFDCKRW